MAVIGRLPKIAVRALGTLGDRGANHRSRRTPVIRTRPLRRQVPGYLRSSVPACGPARARPISVFQTMAQLEQGGFNRSSQHL